MNILPSYEIGGIWDERGHNRSPDTQHSEENLPSPMCTSLGPRTFILQTTQNESNSAQAPFPLPTCAEWLFRAHGDLVVVPIGYSGVRISPQTPARPLVVLSN